MSKLDTWEKDENLRAENKNLRRKVMELEDIIIHAKDFLMGMIDEEVVEEAFGENDESYVDGFASN